MNCMRERQCFDNFIPIETLLSWPERDREGIKKRKNNSEGRAMNAEVWAHVWHKRVRLMWEKRDKLKNKLANSNQNLIFGKISAYSYYKRYGPKGRAAIPEVSKDRISSHRRLYYGPET